MPKPKPIPDASLAKKARFRARRRATLAICGPDSRRPGGRLFGALCELADRFLQRRGDPWANRLGTVLFYVAFHSARAPEDDDFRLSLRSSLDMLIELDPLGPMESLQPLRERGLPASPPPDPRPGQPAPVPYPTFADDPFAFPGSSS
jgi:hypothetical protein